MKKRIKLEDDLYVTVDVNQNIWTDDRHVNYKDGRRQRTRGVLKAQTIGKRGYKYISISKNNISKKFYVHRIMAEAFVKNEKPDVMTFVNHIDGNKLNNDARNLEWVTRVQNIKHASETGLLNTKAVYSEVLSKKWNSQISCARDIGLSVSTVSEILNGKRQKNIYKIKYYANEEA